MSSDTSPEEWERILSKQKEQGRNFRANFLRWAKGKRSKEEIKKEEEIYVFNSSHGTKKRKIRSQRGCNFTKPKRKR